MHILLKKLKSLVFLDDLFSQLKYKMFIPPLINLTQQAWVSLIFYVHKFVHNSELP